VLIAFFSGLAGIVAGTRKQASNVMPGVAIATALMPPLCTAGFGLAFGNQMYFFGALYLFFINSPLISLATILIVKNLQFKKYERKYVLNLKSDSIHKVDVTSGNESGNSVELFGSLDKTESVIVQVSKDIKEGPYTAHVVK